LENRTVVGLQALLSRRREPSQRVRRAIVAAAGVGILVIAAAPVLSEPLDMPRQLGLLLWLIAFVVVSVPLWLLSEYRRGVVRRDTADERERQRRNDAYRISYRIIEWSVPFVALGVVFREAIGSLIQDEWIVLYILLYGYVAFLPYMVFAWREPDAAE
jgi:hypothetical protein